MLKMDEYKYLDKYERKIIAFLDSRRTEISTREIANSLGIHWTTAKKSLESLEKKEVIKRIVMGNKILWKMYPIRI